MNHGIRLALVLGVGCLPACGGGSAGTATAPAGGRAVGNDMSRCDFEGRSDREVTESSGPGATTSNIRRVFAIVGEGEDRRRVLVCREVDTNLDGVKDVVRTYDDKGQVIEEQADSKYSGKIDTWIRFAAGRIAKVEIDRSGDGRADETRYYVRGKLSRVQRDTNNDGRPDVWEMYTDGRLERMGIDLDHDGHVDRWDRHEIARRIAEEKEREEEARQQAARKAAEAPSGATP
jgi:hypothetical protein